MMESVFAFITLFMKILPSLITAGTTAWPLINRAIAIWNSAEPPTEDDWKMLHAFEAAMTAQIQAPITDEEFAP